MKTDKQTGPHEKHYVCAKCGREWHGILTGSSKCIKCKDGWMVENAKAEGRGE